MKNLTRRGMFAAMGSISAMMFVSGCVTSRHGDTTKVTINVAKINAYVDASVNAAETLSSMAMMVPALAIYVAPIKSVITLLQKGAGELNTTTGGKLEITYTDTSAMTIVTSIFDLVKELVDIAMDVVKAMGKNFISSDAVAKADTIYNSLKTLLSIFKLVLTPSLADNAKGNLPRLEAQTLRILNA